MAHCELFPKDGSMVGRTPPRLCGAHGAWSPWWDDTGRPLASTPWSKAGTFSCTSGTLGSEHEWGSAGTEGRSQQYIISCGGWGRRAGQSVFPQATPPPVQVANRSSQDMVTRPHACPSRACLLLGRTPSPAAPPEPDGFSPAPPRNQDPSLGHGPWKPHRPLGEVQPARGGGGGAAHTLGSTTDSPTPFPNALPSPAVQSAPPALEGRSAQEAPRLVHTGPPSSKLLSQRPPLVLRRAVHEQVLALSALVSSRQARWE